MEKVVESQLRESDSPCGCIFYNCVCVYGCICASSGESRRVKNLTKQKGAVKRIENRHFPN